MLRDFSACFKRYDIAILTYNIIANNVIFSAKGCKQHYTHKRRKSQRLYHSLTSAVTITYAPRENRRIIFSKALSSKLKSIYIFHLQYWCPFLGEMACYYVIFLSTQFSMGEKRFMGVELENRGFSERLYTHWSFGTADQQERDREIRGWKINVF